MNSSDDSGFGNDPGDLPPESRAPGSGPRSDSASNASSSAPASAGASTGAPHKSFARRNWGKMTLLAILGVPLAGFAFWVIIGLNVTYSEGERAGYIQKISRRGWLCKTWEGTLYTDIAKGFRSDSFNFSVRKDSLAREIEKLSGKRVAVQYEQHKLLPTNCFGDTEYYVSGVRVLPDGSE